MDFFQSVEKSHGRDETRRYWHTTDIQWFEDKALWKGLRSFGMVESIRGIKGVNSIERRYYLCSLPLDAERFAKAVRGHWGVENALHWSLDVTFGEDRSRARTKNAAQNVATLRRLALNIIKRKPVKCSLDKECSMPHCETYMRSGSLDAFAWPRPCSRKRIGRNAARRLNVLFIAIDDLNDWVGCLGGHPQAITPHMDALAASGMLFENAHCQAPICTPSRCSLLSGRYPSTSGLYFLAPQYREAETLRNMTSLPQYFMEHGYKSMGAGKIFHTNNDPLSFHEYGGDMGSFGPRPEKKISLPRASALGLGRLP